MFTGMKIKSLKKKIEAMMKNRQENTVSEDETNKEIALHVQLAKVYDSLALNKKYPNAGLQALEAYRAAAILEDAESQYIIGNRRLELGKFWDEYRQSSFKAAVHDRYAQEAYDEAFAYLEAAVKQKHPLAMRTLGLAYINGWGKPVDQDQGFQFIVDSIDVENAWDRATQIFESIGLNKPEFFATMMKMRGKGS